MTDIVMIENDHWRVGLVPTTGGSVASGELRQGDAWVHVLRPTPEADLGVAANTASYPLVPWSNRVRGGELRWRGEVHRLRVNFPDGTAIHGTGMEFPWAVAASSPTSATLTFDSRDFAGVNFPWPFTAELGYELDGPRFTWTMSVTNVGDVDFPAGLGHHPYFVRALDGAANAVLQINCAKGYALEDAMATAAAGDVPARADFREARPIGDAFADDCLTARTSAVVATIAHPDGPTLTIEADDVLSHVVVYLPVGENFFAVEPVTNANDGFALHDRGVESVGVLAVAPGETLAASFTIVGS